jgi:hypothetical protein
VVAEIAVHALMAAVLVGTGGLDELGPNPQPEPPDAELREAAERTGGEGLPVIGADPLRQAKGPEEPLEHLLGGLEQRAFEPIAGQEVAGVGVLHGERVAVAAIAEPELALKSTDQTTLGPVMGVCGRPGWARTCERRRRRTRPCRTRMR